MKLFALLVVFVFAVAVAFSSPSEAPLMMMPCLGKDGDWQDCSFLSSGTVFVSSNKKVFERDPIEIPNIRSPRAQNALINFVPEKGWFRLKTSDSAILNKAAVCFNLLLLDDPSWVRFSPMKIIIEKNEIRLLVRKTIYIGERGKDFYPSKISVKEIIEHLKPGEYKIFLDKTFLGKICIFP